MAKKKAVRKAKAKASPAQLKARAEFKKNAAKARKLVDNGEAKSLKAAWKKIK